MASMDFTWSKHYSVNKWFLETERCHVAGEVSNIDGKYFAGHAIPYRCNKDGTEQDWQPAPLPFDLLHEAFAWVEANAHWTVQGEFFPFLVIK